jgi:acetolactate synthase I/II/III large subunit
LTTSRELADTLAAAAHAAGVRVMFGVPGGGPNLDMIGAAQAVDIRFVLMHDENAAVTAAATYGLTSGTVGCAIVTRGPGLTNAINGLATAQLDRLPVILVSDTVPAATPHVDHQRLDQVAVATPVCKHSGVLGGDSSAAQVAADAFALAGTHPWGAVHLAFDPSGTSTTIAMPAPASGEPDAAAYDAALRMVRGARQPVVILGEDLLGLASDVRDMLDGANVPVLTTYQAKGLIGDDDDRYAGLFTGVAMEGRLLADADVVLALGLDPVEPMPGRWSYEPPVILISRRPLPMGYFPEGTPAVVGDAPALAADLLRETSPTWQPDAGRTFRESETLALAVEVAGLDPADVVRTFAAGHSRATVDAGAHFLVAMPLWPATEPGQVLISNGLATMGFALPAAIGAWHAVGSRIVALTGDGGLGMCLAELETLARTGAAVTVVVFNDAALTLIGLKQREGQGGPSAINYGPIDFAAIARAMGVEAVVADSPATLNDAAQRSSTMSSGPLLVDARIDPSGYPHVIRTIRG